MKLTQRIALGLALVSLTSCGVKTDGAAENKDTGKTETSGDPSKTDTADKAVKTVQKVATDADESKPADSTGALVSTSLNFGSAAAIALWLVEETAPEATMQTMAEPEAPATGGVPDASMTTTTASDAPVAAPAIAISDSVSVEWARASIAAVKIKPTKELTAKDQENGKQELEEDAAEATEIVAASEEADAMALEGKKPEDMANAKDEPKSKLDAGKAKLEAKKGEVKAKLVAKKDMLKQKLKERSEKAKGRDAAMKFAGPYVYDFVAGALVGDAPKVDLQDGSYRRIEFKLRPNFDVADTDPLFGQALAIKGTVKIGDELVPFALDMHAAMNLRLAGDGGMGVTPGSENKLGIVFDLKGWFEGVDMGAAEIDPETGVILVDHRHNKTIWQQIRKNVKLKSRFGKDGNADGKIGADEVAGEGEMTVDAVE